MAKTRYAFFKGQIVPIEKAKVSIMTHAFNYGTGCFEGIRAYWNDEKEELYVLKMREHYQRLHRSCHFLIISLPYDVDTLCDITLELLRKEGFQQDVYVRPLAYKASEKIAVQLQDMEDEFAIFAIPFGKYIEKEEGARVCVSSWQRISDNAIPARAKISGSYINPALIKTEAIMNGYDEAIALTADGHVSEGSAQNLFIVQEGKMITSPVTEDILEGITRASLIELARDELGIETVERKIDRSELYMAEEAFFCGTGVQIVAIASIDHRTVGTGEIGPIMRQLRDLYFEIVRGKNKKYAHWVTPVYAEAKRKRLAAT